ncbi:MAG: hypothetical protein IGR92_12685 [Leptolyngbyaceae cyanobacterium T60_A2020_046]|nr:hypothetical protein [Leptolyngbyaceae cyanobacterium T60_A2020_046]
MSLPDLIATVTAGIDGLWFPSETDAPWTLLPNAPEPTDGAALRAWLGQPASAPVESLAIADFLAQVERRCRGYGAEGKAIAQRHRDLIAMLRDRCDTLTVWRVGTVTLDVVIIGTLETGDRVALGTQSVET